MDINENHTSTAANSNDTGSKSEQEASATTNSENNSNEEYEDSPGSSIDTSSIEKRRKRKNSRVELCSKFFKTDDDKTSSNEKHISISLDMNPTVENFVSDMEVISLSNAEDVNEDENSSTSGDKVDEDAEENASSSSDEAQHEKAESSDSSSSSSSSDSSLSLLSTSEEEALFSDNEDENDENNSDSPATDEDDDDEFDDVVSWNIGLQVPFDEDSASSSDEQKTGKATEKLPKVLQKTLPAEKFSFLRAITERQFKGDDPKRRSHQRFENKVYSSRSMVQHFKLFRSLKKHTGCVNCVSFNHSGEILISASDDKRVSLWDWSHNKNLLFFDSGHLANVFQAKFLPFSNDTKLITCGQDSQVRMSILNQCGVHSTRMIMKHERTVHKIAQQPQMPNTFLSAGEDGVVYSIDIREPKPICSKLLKMVATRTNNTVSLYSIHCNPLKNYEFVVCGNDKDIRLFDQRKVGQENSPPVKTFCPASLSPVESTSFRKSSQSVTCALFSYNGSEILSSYNDNDIYLFDTMNGKEVHHYDGHRNFATIKGVNFFGPRSEYIISGSDCGYVYIWDKDSEAIVQWLKGDDNIVNCLEPHPSFPALATSGLDSDVKIWMPTSDQPVNVREMKEFIKVTKKNHYYKVNNFARFPGRSVVVPMIFDPENVTFPEARSRLPVILRYRRTLRAVLQRRTQRGRSSSDDDTPPARDCDLSF